MVDEDLRSCIVFMLWLNMYEWNSDRVTLYGHGTYFAVKEYARQFHSPDGDTVGISASEYFNRVRYAPKRVRRVTLARLVTIYGI